MTVKRGVLLEGASLNGAPEIPFGVTSPLVTEEVKLLFSWLAIGEATAAIVGLFLLKDFGSKSNVCIEICKLREMEVGFAE